MPNNKRARARDLVEALLDLIDKHGDLPIFLDDPDTGWIMDVGVEKTAITPYSLNDLGLKTGDCYIAITSSYSGKPDGAL